MSAFGSGRVTAQVHVRDWTARDRLGNHVEAYASPVPVTVLVAPANTSDLGASRPEGVRVDLTLHFPKTWTDPSTLRDAKIDLPEPWGGTYMVVGSPQPYAPSLSPLDLYMPVVVVAYDG